ncbi:MAG: hypothetical protein EOP26_07950 [Rhodococcus sp. (in: high G+C Gram-positive bacteria)]|nr:MAG: hypothetical protein EOP26_07950 [Rhodococcus sp. (in: high G+C Gram-positive bacteria)]
MTDASNEDTKKKFREALERKNHQAGLSTDHKDGHSKAHEVLPITPYPNGRSRTAELLGSAARLGPKKRLPAYCRDLPNRMVRGCFCTLFGPRAAF